MSEHYGVQDRRESTDTPAPIIGCIRCRHCVHETCRHPDVQMPDFINGGRQAPFCTTARAFGACGVAATLFEEADL